MQFGTFRFCFMGGFQRRATALLGRKNPKKPVVSWQGIQRGQRPLGTRLCLQSLVCYTFAKGLAANGLFCPQGWAKEDGHGLKLQSDYSGRRQPGPAPEQRDTVLPPRISAPNNQRDLHRIRAWYHIDITCWYHCDTTSRECGNITAWYRLSASSVLPDRTVL